MQLRHLFIATTLAFALSSPVFAAGKSSSFQCWVNKQGIRECGNEVPPEYSQGKTETINKYGITTKVEARAKTKEEAEAEQRAQEEQARKEAQEKQALKEQQAYDRVLLASYFSEQDINSARNRRLSAIDAAIDMTNNSITQQQGKLNKEEQRAAALKKSGKAVSADDQSEMDSLRKEINDKKVFIAAKQKEREATNVEYDGYVKRFRELKGTK